MDVKVFSRRDRLSKTDDELVEEATRIKDIHSDYKTKEAERVLAELHAMVQAHQVVFMDVPNTVGALADIAERLAEAGINIEYAYCTTPPSQSAGALVLRTNDLEATINALS